MPTEIEKDQNKIYQIYDHFRTILLNKKYYGHQLQTHKTYVFWMDMLIAIGTAGSGASGFAVWQWDYGKPVWAILSGSAILLAMAKPLLKLTERVENYAKLYGEYTSLFAKIKIVVEDIQVERSVAADRIKVFEELRTRAAELAQLDDANPSRKLIRRYEKEVIDEVNIERLWLPTTENKSPAAVHG